MNDDFTDEYGRNDPETQERERRRLEREEKRRKSGRDTAEQKAADPEPQPPPAEQPRGRQDRPELPSASPTRRRADPAAPTVPQRSAPADTADPARAPSSPPPGKPRLKRSASGSGPRWLRLALLAVAALILLFGVLLFQPFHGEGSGEVVVTIPDGATASQISDQLDQQGVIANPTLFRIRLRLSGHTSDIEANTYNLLKGMSYGAAIDALTVPPKAEPGLVIPEGFSRDQIANVASQAGLQGNYKQETIKSKLLNPRKYGGKKAPNLEGFLFPATYELEPGSNVKELVDQQLTAFKQQIGGVDMRFAKKKNLTVFDVLIIASMVEREVQIAKERPLVAAVIYNRLKDGMPLGIDATVRFATGNYDKPLTQSELNSNSPYNTRKFAGLPPGPIGNPGLEAIKAAAHPANVKYLFYVVKPGTCGEHSFANTAAEFDELVAKYNKARREAGGKSPTNCPDGG